MNTATYERDVDEWGHKGHSIDMPRFAIDLANALGGTVIKRENEFASDRYMRAAIAIGDLTIRISRSRQRGKVAIHVDEAKPYQFNGNAPYGDKYRLPCISVAYDRPMKALVGDITKRLLLAAQPAIAARAAYAAELAESMNTLEKHASRLIALGFEIRGDGPHSRSIYRNREDEPYLHGTLSSDGSIRFEHLSLDAEQAQRLFAALLKDA